MRKISLWARGHIMHTRFLIGFLYIVINLLALFLGDLLFSVSITLPILFVYLPLSLFFMGLIIYPVKDRKHSYRNYYFQQKSADLLLAISSFLFVVYGGNTLNKTSHTNLSSAYAASFSIPSTQLVKINSQIDFNIEPGTVTKKP